MTMPHSDQEVGTIYQIRNLKTIYMQPDMKELRKNSHRHRQNYSDYLRERRVGKVEEI